ncbi:hypothetical protein C8Q75DRAFT_1715 [Abortiporus biennis]|nr:hypothetical protein C8Q75DRAFT_1715 [Abortiporus biennis]
MDHRFSLVISSIFTIHPSIMSVSHVRSIMSLSMSILQRREGTSLFFKIICNASKTCICTYILSIYLSITTRKV